MTVSLPLGEDTRAIQQYLDHKNIQHRASHVSQHRCRSRAQRVDVHRSGQHFDRIRRCLRRDRCPRCLERAGTWRRTWPCNRALYDLALDVESVALRLLREHKPGRRLETNVEFYTALLLHGLSFTTELFTPTFAIGRVVGWIAHTLEQRNQNRLMRPRALYSGSRSRKWTPLVSR